MRPPRRLCRACRRGRCQVLCCAVLSRAVPCCAPQRDQLASMIQEWAATSAVDSIMGVWIGVLRTGQGLNDFALANGTSLGSYGPPWAPGEPNDAFGIEVGLTRQTKAAIEQPTVTASAFEIVSEHRSS